MGTGKTRLAIAIDLVRREKGSKTLVICPTAAVRNVWVAKLEELTDLAVGVIDPVNRAKSFFDFVANDKDVLIIHWAALRLIPELKQISWHHIIADEAHRICNRKTQTSVFLKQIKAKYKTALTGTPTDGRPDKLWSILNWLYPKQYTSFWKFNKEYSVMDIVYPGGYRVFIKPKNIDKLRDDQGRRTRKGKRQTHLVVRHRDS